MCLEGGVVTTPPLRRGGVVTPPPWVVTTSLVVTTPITTPCNLSVHPARHGSISPPLSVVVGDLTVGQVARPPRARGQTQHASRQHGAAHTFPACSHTHCNTSARCHLSAYGSCHALGDREHARWGHWTGTAIIGVGGSGARSPLVSLLVSYRVQPHITRLRQSCALVRPPTLHRAALTGRTGRNIRQSCALVRPPTLHRAALTGRAGRN